MGIVPSSQTIPISFPKLSRVFVEGEEDHGLRHLLRAIAAYGRAFVRHAEPRDGETVMGAQRRALVSSADRAMTQGRTQIEKRTSIETCELLRVVCSVLHSKTKRLKQQSHRAAGRARQRGEASTELFMAECVKAGG